MLQDAQITERFDALGPWLARWRGVWSVAPFREHQPAWTRAFPELAAWLLARDEAQIADLEHAATAPDAPEPWGTLVAEAAALSALGPLPGDPPLPARHPLARRVKGRKWAQVRGFLAVVEPRLRGGQGTLVEGCAGRGHLGRTLAVHLGREGLLLERDPTLCAPPDAAPEVDGVRHATLDVLSDAALHAVPPGASVLGLHACGRLTDRLITIAEHVGAPFLAMAPCCPHRLFGHDAWCANSEAGAAHGLTLGPDDLHLAVLDEVIASPRRRALRRREMVLRVAVDLLQREATGEDRYHGFASCPRAVFDLPLREAVGVVAEAFPLRLPTRWDADRVEQEAVEQVRRIRALALLRMRFRRPLELWTVLDRAQRLVERGRAVEVGTFCAPDASPRNLVVIAR